MGQGRTQGPERDARPVEADALLGRLALLLASGAGPAAALDLLVEAVGLRRAVLRAPDGALLAVAGDVVHAVPGPRSRALAVAGPGLELPVQGADGRLRAVLGLAAARPSQLPVLRAAASVLALALPAPVAAPADLASVHDRELAGLADALHDGAVQDLVAARWSLDAASPAGDPLVQGARDAVHAALVGLRRTMWQLRPRGADLADDLAALSARLEEAGVPGLSLVVDPAAVEDLRPAVRALAYRLVQASAAAAAARGDGLRVVLRRSGGAVALDLDGALPLPEPDGWRLRLQAVGGDLTTLAGRLRVLLPGTDCPPDPTPLETKACS